MQVDSNTQLGKLVTANPDASRVLLRHGLDFCCGGAQTLAEACTKANLEIDQVLAEVAAIRNSSPDTPWDELAPELLITHILEVYHGPLPEELQQIQAMAERVLDVHGEKDPERLAKLASSVTGLRMELLAHMEKEEEILFPWIKAGEEPKPEAPIEVMQQEHEDAGAVLELIKELTDNFTPPPEACNTWRNLYARLQSFDADLREHIHLENNILFPRALA